MRNTGNIEAIYPLSPMQEGILFHVLYSPQTMGYFEQQCHTMEGDLNVQAFEQAWQEIVARHPILRTLFTWEKRNQPLQLVRQKVTVPFAYQDWRSYSPSEQHAQLETFLISDREQGFNLSKAPLMRLALMRLSERRYQFTWSFHHLLLDGWSGPIILSEFFNLYEGFCRSESPALPHRRPYRDYIRWLQHQDLSQAEKFWRAYLEGFTEPTPFGIDQPKPKGQTEAYAKQEIVLPEAIAGQLQQLTQQHHLTLSTLIQGVWAIILSRYSNERDVIFGTTVSGRGAPLEDIENMVGLFINTLPLRVLVRPEASLLEWLQALQAQQTERRLYEHSPLTHIQHCSDLPGNVPLFESILVLGDSPIPQLTENEQRSLTIREISVFGQTNYPLTVQVIPGKQLSWQFLYDCYRFGDATITRMQGHIQTLLESIVADPDRPLSELAWLTEKERQQLLIDWNPPHTDAPPDQSINALFEAQVSRTPEAIAVAYEDQHLTYAELNRRSNQLAHYLQGQGVGPEVLVGICVERSLEMVVGLLGILKAGGAYVPLDPAYPAERLAFMLSDAKAPVLLTQKRLVDKLPAHAGEIFCLDGEESAIARENEENPASGATPANLAYVIYTSGSTGQPKGVEIQHAGVVNLIAWHQQTYKVTPADRATQLASLAFDASVWELWPYLTAGASIHIPNEETRSFPTKLLEWLSVEAITLSFMPTPLAESVLEEQLPKSLALRALLTGGDRLHRMPPKGLPFRLVNHYGPTENTVVTTWAPVAPVSEADAPPPIGRPIANTQVYILDVQLQPVPIGVAGELYTSGDGLARGYLNRPELTAENFIPNPFSKDPATRIYKTGDLARYLPDGNIEFLGRIDHQVKIRGFRIELGEVESVLGRHPAVGEAVVIAREDVPGDKRLVAYVVASHEPTPTFSELRSFLKEKLPDYMIPTVLVFLDLLPLTPNGKLDRRALPAPGKDRQELTESSVKPRDELEIQLTKIWEKVLGIKNVGIKDNFFDLGGHSLLAMQLFVRIRKIFGKDLPLNILFQAPTIEQLACIFRQEGFAAPWSSLVPIQNGGARPPFFCTHGCTGRVLHFHDLARHLGPDQPFYGLTAQGMDNEKDPQKQIEEIAAHYIKEIQTIQLDGPYFIGGSGGGCAIAFEMAHQLKSQGQKVALIVLISPPHAQLNLSDLDTSNLDLSIGSMPLREFYHLLITLIKSRPLMPAIKNSFSNRILYRWKIFHRFIPIEIHRRRRFLKSFNEALLSYTPKAYLGRISFILRDEFASNPQKGLCDWQSLSVGGLDVRFVPGTFMTMWREPHVQILADQLKSCLDEAQKNS